MLTRSKFAAALVLVGLALATSLAAKPDAKERANLEARLEKLRADRVESARKACEAYRAAFEAETVSLLDVLVAFDAQLDAELDAAKTPDEAIAARKQYVLRVRQAEEKIKALYDVGARGGEAEKYAKVKSCREAAEIALIKAQLAEGQ
jgi:hypothetical protein